MDPFIVCEEKQIKQVLLNILKNAIEAIPNGGFIRIQLSNHEEGVLIRVIDNGMGIPKDRIQKLGEPFYTTKEKRTGLGLRVCFKIIEFHQGKITYKSELGEGTTVDIILPIVQTKKA